MTAPPVEILCDAALFLDFDGTLVSLADRPDAVHVDAALRRLLADLHHALNGRLAIVSGRSVETLIDDFGLGDFIIAGTHGLQYHQPGLAMDAPVRLQAVDHAQRAMESFASDKPGVFVERKTLSVGLHFRLGERWTRECEALALQLADELGLYVQAGKAIFELRPGGADKGSAVRRLMDLPVMSGGSPVFIGDDVTDEEGFEAAADLGGGGILVGLPRRTKARWRLEHVEHVKHYLAGGAAFLKGEPLPATGA